jgi:hypothetical protein
MNLSRPCAPVIMPLSSVPQQSIRNTKHTVRALLSLAAISLDVLTFRAAKFSVTSSDLPNGDGHAHTGSRIQPHAQGLLGGSWSARVTAHGGCN